ncbi:MAG TPA: hypothetical protein VK607_01295, partial [Kofleriaceae bacterium]|nr:hypothetical protein [Kofleriaceae bacterium]
MVVVALSSARDDGEPCPPVRQDEAAMRAYWRFYLPRSAAISSEMRRAELALPEWNAVVDPVTMERLRELERRDRVLLGDAI